MDSSKLDFSTKEKLTQLLETATADKRFITWDKPKKLISTDYALDKLIQKIYSLPAGTKKRIEALLSQEQKLDVIEKLFLNYLYNITPTNCDDGMDVEFGKLDIEDYMKNLNKFKTEPKEVVDECFHAIINGTCGFTKSSDVWKYFTKFYEYAVF